jgi:rhodanese-related sulfurtransferase
MKRIVFVVMIFIPGVFYGQEVQKIKSADLNELLKEQTFQIIDVRTPEEVSFGIIEGASNLDYYDGAFRSKADQLDKEKPTVIYCAVGVRSAYASNIFKELGFKEVYDLTDGFRGWKSGGYPIVRPPK